MNLFYFKEKNMYSGFQMKRATGNTLFDIETVQKNCEKLKLHF